MTLFKILENGKSCHGGNLQWDLPKQDGDIWIPGAWHSVEGDLAMCKRGIHLTDSPYKWYTWNCQCWEAEARGAGSCDEQERKCVARSARLLRPVEHPAWWIRAHEFVEKDIPAVPWLCPDGKPDASWKLFEMPDLAAAWDAAWDAAGDAARAAAAAGDAARDAAGAAAWVAAGDAAAARDAAGAAALYIRCRFICDGLPLDLNHRKHAEERWNVWSKGYGLACAVDGVLYVYGTKPKEPKS
mgnify:CR=1 FL=1